MVFHFNFFLIRWALNPGLVGWGGGGEGVGGLNSDVSYLDTFCADR